VSVTVGYLGPRGSHTSAAAAVLVPDARRSVDLPSFTAVVDAATAFEVELGVLPIESSLIGPIAETHDLLYGSPLSIVQEVTLPIRHCLLGLPGSSRAGAKVVRSHPAALDQCRDLLSGWRVHCISSPSTADAAREVAESGDIHELALASMEAADTYGLEIVEDDVGDRPGAFTRFVALAPYTRIEAEEKWRTAISFVTDHRPGALYHALGAFERNGVNMVQLVSRPLPNSPWRYRFDVILDGSVFADPVRPALADLRNETREVRLFGSYPQERPS
jgi:prephenate dehydratase